MNPEIKAKWVAALRSGEFEQGRGVLHTRAASGREDRYCCLGVLCDIAIREGLAVAKGTANFSDVSYDGDSAFLPWKVVEWAGLEGGNPAVRRDDGLVDTLSFYNDQGKSFDEIADMIEEYL